MVASAFNRRKHPGSCRRIGLANLELVLVTAVALPLGFLLFLLGVQICRYVFRGLGGMLTLPLL